MKRIVIFVLSLFLTASSVVAQISTPWTGDTASAFTGGAGTEADPYLVTTGDELALIMSNVRTGLDYYEDEYIRLENDIDLGGALATPTKWFTNGMGARRFKGTFDGNNKKIHNIYQDAPTASYGGFFGATESMAVVKNLTIASGSITAMSYVGAIVGSNRGKIINCYNYVDIKAITDSRGFSYVGGIAGDNTGYINTCINYGDILGKYYVGGLVGTQSNMRNKVAILDSSLNFGNVVLEEGADYVIIGGLIGEIKGSGAFVKNCANFGALNLGNFEGDVTSTAAMAGVLKGGIIKSCYSAGNVFSKLPISGVSNLGFGGGTSENCFVDAQLSAQALPGIEGGKCISTKAMTTAAGLEGFDAAVWSFVAGQYPMLKVFEAREGMAVQYTAPYLSYTDTITYDVFNAVTSNFELPSVAGVNWELIKGTTAVINGNNVTITRLANQSDTLTLKASKGSASKEFMLVVLKEALTLTITQPEYGVIKAYDGVKELKTLDKVEVNTVVTLETIVEDAYIFDYFTINGQKIEEVFFTMLENTTVAAVLIPDTPPSPWDGIIATEFGGGNGGENSPYLIKSPQQLALLAKNVNAGTIYEGIYFKLVFDLDLNNHEWAPIGLRGETAATTYAFSGNFNGNNKVISNLSITAPENSYIGLFGTIGATSELSDLDITDANIEVSGVADAHVGVLVGNSSGAISNCKVAGTITGTAEVVGGVIGRVAVTVSNLVSDVNINVTATSVGGIAGSSMVATIENSTNISDSVVGTGNVGGILGYSNASIIRGCSNSALIKSKNTNAGGITAVSTGSVRIPSIVNSYNSGEVLSLTLAAGGIVAQNNGNISNCMNAGRIYGLTHGGGIAGSYSNAYTSVRSSYNIGVIIESNNEQSFAGELIGQYLAGDIEHIYIDKQLNPTGSAFGNRSDEGEYGLLTYQLTDSLPNGFDTIYWKSVKGQYPLLKNKIISDKLTLEAAAITLATLNDSVYDTEATVRSDFGIFTETGVAWSVIKGTTLVIEGEKAKITPLIVVDTVILEASYNGLVKEYHLIIPPSSCRLFISESIGGKVIAKDADNNILVTGAELRKGDVVTLSYETTEGYTFKEWYDKTSTETKEIVMSADTTVSALFKKNTYTIEASAVEGGSITPNGITTVEYSESVTYTILAENGYKITHLLVDTDIVEAKTSYTFSNITANHTIEAVFEKQKFKVSASTGENGQISPIGDSLVGYGASITYVITPDEGYEISDLKIDGSSTEIAATYTFNTVIGAHTIHAEFTKSVSVENLLAQNVDIYTDENNIIVENNISENINLSVYNVSGLRIADLKNIKSGTLQIPVATKGIYLVRIQTEDNVIVKKIICM